MAENPRCIERGLVTSNPAMDSDTYSAPLRAPISARHCERYVPFAAGGQLGQN
jgi:hypothetical protein